MNRTARVQYSVTSPESNATAETLSSDSSAAPPPPQQQQQSLLVNAKKNSHHHNHKSNTTSRAVVAMEESVGVPQTPMLMAVTDSCTTEEDPAPEQPPAPTAARTSIASSGYAMTPPPIPSDDYPQTGRISETEASSILTPHMSRIGYLNGCPRTYTSQFRGKTFEIKIKSVNVALSEVSEATGRAGKPYKRKVYMGMSKIVVPEEFASIGSWFPSSNLELMKPTNTNTSSSAYNNNSN